MSWLDLKSEATLKKKILVKWFLFKELMQQLKKKKENEWMNEIPTIAIHYLAKPQQRVSLLLPII